MPGHSATLAVATEEETAHLLKHVPQRVCSDESILSYSVLGHNSHNNRRDLYCSD